MVTRWRTGAAAAAATNVQLFHHFIVLLLLVLQHTGFGRRQRLWEQQTEGVLLHLQESAGRTLGWEDRQPSVDSRWRCCLRTTRLWVRFRFNPSSPSSLKVLSRFSEGSPASSNSPTGLGDSRLFTGCVSVRE